MNEMGVSGALGAAFHALRTKTLESGREIDQVYVQRGFVSVQAQIDFHNRVFGPRSYENFLQSQADPAAFERSRDRSNALYASLGEAERTSRSALDAMWNDVLEDPLLGGYTKSSILQRFFSARVDELVAPHMQAIEEARLEEQRRVCTLYPEPGVPLFDDEKIGLRKEVSNAVMADAYGALGFTMFKRRRGLDIYCKALTPSHAVIVELDPVLLEKHYQEWARSAVQRPMMPLDRICYLGSPRKADNTRWLTFVPINNCVASMGWRYYDTRSLEVAIRAGALWYELTIAPFEQAIRTSST